MSDLPPHVIVKWLDSAVSPETWDIEEAKDMTPIEMVSCGFLVREDEQGIVLASDAYPDGRWRRLLAIPEQAINAVIKPQIVTSVTVE